MVAAREATVITTEGTRAEAARAWRPRSGVAPAGRTARPLSARAGAWAGVASGEAHRGGAVVPFVLAIAVERAATSAASFREARIGRALPLPSHRGEPPFTDSNGCAVKIICKLFALDGVRSRHLPVPVMHT